MSANVKDTKNSNDKQKKPNAQISNTSNNSNPNDIAKSRLSILYKDTIRAKMMKQFAYQNIHEVKKVCKIVLSMGVNKHMDMKKCFNDMMLISGQKPVITKAKKSISQFSVRQGFDSGVKVTLRNQIMYHFMDRLVNIGLLNWRSFTGLNIRSINKIGKDITFSFGLPDKKIFPEIQDTGLKLEGLNVTVCTNCRTAEEFKFLMEEFGFPFRRS